MEPPAAVVAVAKPAQKPAAPESSSSSGTNARYFEYVDDKSNKFWEISKSGCDVTTRWGRIGSNGQSKTKTFPQKAVASEQVNKLIEEKTSEGYVEKKKAD